MMGRRIFQSLWDEGQDQGRYQRQVKLGGVVGVGFIRIVMQMGTCARVGMG